MDLQLNARRALVTGSNAGIGLGIARMLIEEGCAVVVHGRNHARAEAVAAEIGAAGIAVGDLATEEGADATYEAARKALGGGVEILVNNAGGGNGTDSASRGPMDVTVPEWLASFQGNTLACVRMNLRAIPDMIEAKWGRVIHISSAVAVQPNNLGPDYSGAKAALNNLTVSMAGSLKGTGVTVNTVSPGIVLTETLLTWGRQIAEKSGWGPLSDEDLERRLVTELFDLPSGRIGRVEDIGLMVCLLASPRMGYVTGANHRIDGGLVRSVN